MKGKIITILVSLLAISIIFAGNSIAGDGPAPNSGDGVPDGSGFDDTHGSNGVGSLGNGHGGPAPNSGDGVPDGPGWPE